MKICPKCNAQLDDNAVFCASCGQPLQATVAVDPYDHTAEFEAEDISNNKAVAMLCYLSGWVGIIIALLAANTSKYASFHVRQAIKIQVALMLIPLALVCAAIVNIIPILGWLVYGLAVIAALVAGVALTVVQIICFFQICKGQAKEPAIINKLNFLR
jgi:uncharacterized membrane protein